MSDLLGHPAIQAGAAPFVTALVVAVCLRRTRLMGLAISAAFMVLVALTVGFSFEALTAQRKLVLMAAATAALVPVLEMPAMRNRTDLAAALAAAAAIAGVWTVLRVLQQYETSMALLAGSASALYMALMVAPVRQAAVVPAAASSFGLGVATGVLALFGASALLAQMGVAIAAGAGAVLLVLMTSNRSDFASWTLALPAAVMCGLVGLVTVFTGSLPWYCLLPVLAVPWAARLTPKTGGPGWLSGALAVTTVLAPVSMAVVLAWLATGASPA